MFQGLCEVLYFVDDVRTAAAWYGLFFGVVPEFHEEDGRPRGALLHIGSAALLVHPADEKMPSGHAGQVVYWNVEDFSAALAHAESLGACLFRGPIAIPGERLMCQVRDPFGVLIGLQGAIIPKAEA